MARPHRFITVLALGAVLLLGVPSASGASGEAVPGETVPLSVRLTRCTRGADAADRTATFTASMPALKGTKRMWMRFQLAQRRGTTGAFVIIPVPGWGDWEKSEANRPGFVFTKRVESLLAPAAYRAQVTLRWLDRHNRIQRQLVRATGTCRQRDPRPDLVLMGLAAHRTPDATVAVYELLIANHGIADAGAFAVRLANGAATLATATVSGLSGHERRLVEIAGPACAAGDTLTITLDATDAVDERDEADDIVSRPCPLG